MALSRGWSLHGNHQAEICGSPTARPAAASGPRGGAGRGSSAPACRRRSPYPERQARRDGRRGVMTSSRSDRCGKAAGRPFKPTGPEPEPGRARSWAALRREARSWYAPQGTGSRLWSRRSRSAGRRTRGCRRSGSTRHPGRGRALAFEGGGDRLPDEPMPGPRGGRRHLGTGPAASPAPRWPRRHRRPRRGPQCRCAAGRGGTAGGGAQPHKEGGPGRAQGRRRHPNPRVHLLDTS